MFASLEDEQKGVDSQKDTLLQVDYLFSIKSEHMKEKGKNENGRVASPESVRVYLFMLRERLVRIAIH